jgi:hypothetical protein
MAPHSGFACAHKSNQSHICNGAIAVHEKRADSSV